MYSEAETGNIRTELGEAIKLRRMELGLTQEELAERVGITDVYLRDLERGIYTANWVICLRIITVLNIDLTPLRDKYIVPEIAVRKEAAEKRKAVNTNA